MNIRSKITMMIIILLNVVIVITGVFSYNWSSKIINTLIKNSAIELTKSQDQLISQLIDNEINLLSPLASDYNVLAPLTVQNNQSHIDTVNDISIFID